MVMTMVIVTVYEHPSNEFKNYTEFSYTNVEIA